MLAHSWLHLTAQISSPSSSLAFPQLMAEVIRGIGERKFLRLASSVGGQAEELPTHSSSSPTTRGFPASLLTPSPGPQPRFSSLHHLPSQGPPALAPPAKMGQWVRDRLNTWRDQEELGFRAG